MLGPRLILAAGVPWSCALVLAPAVAIVLLVVWHTWGQIDFAGNTYAGQDEFLAEFGAAIGLAGRNPTDGWGPEHAVFEGAPHGVPTTLRFVRVTNDREPYSGRLAVPFDEAPRVAIREQSLVDALGKWVGVTREHEVGEAAFDARFLIETHDPRAKRALGDASVRAAIVGAFAAGATRLVFGDRELRAEIDRARQRKVEGYRALIECLAVLRRALQPIEVSVRVFATPKRAFPGATGPARCAYCHADVTGEEPDLVACAQCSTIAHDACWEELGRCPVFGCSGGTRERGRRAPVR